MDLTIIIVSIIIIIIFLTYTENIAGFSNKEEKANILLNNENVLRSNYTASRKKIEWLDPVIYNDAKILLNQNKFSKNNVLNIL